MACLDCLGAGGSLRSYWIPSIKRQARLAVQATGMANGSERVRLQNLALYLQCACGILQASSLCRWTEKNDVNVLSGSSVVEVKEIRESLAEHKRASRARTQSCDDRNLFSLSKSIGQPGRAEPRIVLRKHHWLVARLSRMHL